MLTKTPGDPKHLWHPPFQSSMDIALQSDADHYRILPEQEPTRGPLRLDFLVLLEDGYRMRSRFGKLLKKYTIIEYKGATDYLDIKSFFGGLAHAFQYLMSGTGVSGKPVHIPGIDEVLLMFVCMPFPKKLMDFLNGTPVTEVEPGVYRLQIMKLDVLIVVQSLLEGDDYLWIRNLRRGPDLEEFNRMARQAVDHPEDELRDSLIQFPRATSQADMLACPFGDCRESQKFRCKHRSF